MFQVSENITGGIVGQIFGLFSSIKPLLILVIGILMGVFILGKILGIFMERLAEKRVAREKEAKLVWTGRKIEAEVEKEIEKEISAEVGKRARAIIKVRVEEYLEAHEKEIEARIEKRLPKLL